MTLWALVMYVIPAVLVMYGVALWLLSRIQKKHVLGSSQDHRISLKDAAE
jgi:hypothetical protein